MKGVPLSSQGYGLSDYLSGSFQLTPTDLSVSMDWPVFHAILLQRGFVRALAMHAWEYALPSSEKVNGTTEKSLPSFHIQRKESESGVDSNKRPQLRCESRGNSSLSSTVIRVASWLSETSHRRAFTRKSVYYSPTCPAFARVNLGLIARALVVHNEGLEK
jgi:hypothetical protein